MSETIELFVLNICKYCKLAISAESQTNPLFSHAAIFVLNGYPDIIRIAVSVIRIANYPVGASPMTMMMTMMLDVRVESPWVQTQTWWSGTQNHRELSQHQHIIMPVISTSSRE